MEFDVRVPVGADHADPDAWLPVERLGDIDLGRLDAMRPRHRDQVEAVRCPEEPLEAIGVERRPLGQEREDPAAVVVEHDDREVDTTVGETEQTVAVVQECDVADQQRGLRPGQRDADSRGDHAVDAVGAAIAHDA